MENNAPSSTSPEEAGDPVESASEQPSSLPPSEWLTEAQRWGALTVDLTAEEMERFKSHRRAGLSPTIALMLACKKAPTGRVKGSQFPTKDWDRDRTR